MIITVILILILLIGFFKLVAKYNSHIKKLEFANEFRNHFVNLANQYLQSYETWSKQGEVNNNDYNWLTKNVDQMQSNLGVIGIINYVAPFGRFHSSNYQVLINTIPKFREKVLQTEINMSDDCLTRYIGINEKIVINDKKELKNPFLWFKEGINFLLILPFNILKWFGLLNSKIVRQIANNFIYKIITGLIALITLISGLVTIIQGKEDTLKFLKEILGK